MLEPLKVVTLTHYTTVLLASCCWFDDITRRAHICFVWIQFALNSCLSLATNELLWMNIKMLTYLNPLSSSMPLIPPFELTVSSFFRPFVSNGELSLSLSSVDWEFSKQYNFYYWILRKYLIPSWNFLFQGYTKNLTLSLSSNLSPRKRGSKPDKGLSLLVGEPPKTNSTIFTPRPLVESRGLQ